MRRKTVFQITAGFAIAPMLAACTLELPGRTFKADGVECSETATKVTVDKAIIPSTIPQNANGETDVKKIEELMKACTEFLKGSSP